MTFSIVARSADSTWFGMAIASSSPAVAARCAHARAGVGVVATQNITDPSLGAKALDALARGRTASEAVAEVLTGTLHGPYRQLLVLGRGAPPAGHSGARALGVVDLHYGTHAAAAGNLLANHEVPSAMVEAFDKLRGDFGSRLLGALRAGAARGGEAGPVHSAGLLIVRDVAWPIVDLRVDWADDDPVAQLETLWHLYSPQVEDYVSRALDPAAAPSFGVPGDS